LIVGDNRYLVNRRELYRRTETKLKILGKSQQLYKKGIIRELYFGKKLSCADLSVKIGRSLPTTAQTLEQLVEDEVVVETGFSNSTGGRRPQLYALRRNMMSIVSVAMDQFVTRIVTMDLHNNFLSKVDRIGPRGSIILFCRRVAGGSTDLSQHTRACPYLLTMIASWWRLARCPPAVLAAEKMRRLSILDGASDWD
jgi:hypothetical protein